MLKMKMMTFFKNPVVRDVFIVLTAVIIVASIISIPVSNAGSQINVAFRAASMGINAGTKDIEIPEISPDQDADKKSKYSNAFCIDEGNHLSYGVYTNEFDAYNKEEASKYFKNYGSALWLIDNMYIADSSNSNVGLEYLAELVTSPDVAKNVSKYGVITTENIKSLNKTVGGIKDTKGNIMNKNFIEVIEQLVLWNYTNNTSSINPDTLVNDGFSGINITANDQNAAKYLYYALKYFADKKSGYTSNGTVSNLVSLDSSKAILDINKLQVGPYAIKSNGVVLNIDSSLKSKISATIAKTDGSTQNLDSSKIVINEDGTFYIDIKDCGQITKSKLNISDIYTGSKTTAHVVVNGKDQNLVCIKKNVNTKPLSDEKTVTYSGKYTVKLIKTKIDGTTEITNNPAKFTISGAENKKGEPTGNDGKLNIASDRTISNVSATETYTIVEDEAPEGYKKYDGTITLDVKFKTDGTSYILDKDNIKMTADGKNGTVRLNVPNNNTIEIYVPNTEQKKEEPKTEFDLSLRKFITKIDGKEVEVSRVPVIDAESKTVLDKTNTAAYHHTKQSLKVKVGSEVEYTIRVYNEGKVDGMAKEITDYLPAGLSFVKIADESSKLYWADAKADSKKVVLKYKGSEVIKADSINRILNNDTNNVYQEVKLICKVNSGYTGYITNRAEITNYGYTDETGKWHEAKAIRESDRDSVQNTIGSSLGLDTWYVNAKTYSYTDNGTVKEIKDYYPGVQDDDDFETVEVEPEKKVEIDLALRKFITKIDGKEVEVSRVPVIDAESKNVLDATNTAAYHHTKQSLKVKEGSEIEYTIRVYNEGKVDGMAKEITDYLPAGLSFVKIADESSKLYSTDAKSDSKKVVLKYNGTEVIKADSINRILNKDTKNVYQEVKLICKVNSESKGYITNRAEITNYGYTDESGKWHEAKAIGNSDRDSVQNTIGNSLGLDTWYENAKTYSYTENGKVKEIKDYYPGVQDDDDFETVEVEPEPIIDGVFKVVLKKVDESHKNQGLHGAYFIINGRKVGPTDENGYVDLVSEQKITSAGQKFAYSIREHTAPKNYDLYEKSITLNIATKESEGKYIIDEENTKLAESDERVALDKSSNVITITVQDKLLPTKFDLALRKFITNVNGREITSRIPKVTLTDDFKSGKVTTATYEHSKEPLEVYTDSIVTYTIRVYNEGKVDGYATKVMDDIPEGLEFLPSNDTNKGNGWVMYEEVERIIYDENNSAELSKLIRYNGKTYIKTDDASKADLIVTENLKDQLIKGYNSETMKDLDYKDVKVAFKVVEPNNSDRIITNYAQITEHKDKDGNTGVSDRDSIPNVWNEGEDDQDIEKIKLMEKDFDLALRKFITNVEGKEITSRIPTVTLTDDFKSGKVTTAKYEHSKDPVDVVKGNTIVYTIRVYNEGEVDGYATKVMDNIPDGLEYLPTNEVNTANGWKMYVQSDAEVEGSITYNNKKYIPTDDASKANLIVTENLKDQLIKAYDAKTMETLDYKDIKVAFRVVEQNTSDKIIINYAQITEHKDKNGKSVEDRDSESNVWTEGEDDQDLEKIRLRHFDLALRKWVTEAIITENGQTQVTKTGHKAEDDPEGIVKVDLKKSKLGNVTVKFRYSIRVTNQGEIAGYAKEVTDYIPQGLKFNAADNKGWTLTESNVAKTDALANTLLNPGESAEVSIVLTWINSESNMGMKINTAEISKDYNEYGAKDIDSTPGNKVPGEDDIDDAPVMLAVKTGSVIISYIAIAVAFFAIIGSGVYTIKRRIV